MLIMEKIMSCCAEQSLLVMVNTLKNLFAY